MEENFNITLLSRLLDVNIKNKDYNKQATLNYLNRMLNANINLFSTQENTILTNIVEKLSQEKSLRFQVLFQRLASLKTQVNKRWSIFYLLNILSNPSNDNEGNINNILNLETRGNNFNDISNNNHINNNSVSNNNLGIFSLLSNHNNTDFNNMYNNINLDHFNNDEYSDYKSISNNQGIPNITDGIKFIKNENNNKNVVYLEKQKTKEQRLVVNKYKTDKLITERDLINDLIYIFQGIDGNYIHYNQMEDRYQLNSHIPFNENIYDIVNQLTEIGWLFRKTRNTIEYLLELNSQSQILQAFVYAVQNEMNYHYKFISMLKLSNSDCERKELNEEACSNIDSDNSDLTLKKLVLLSSNPLEKLKWLTIACDSVYSLRGVQILSQMYAYVNYSYANPLKKVLFTVSQPLFTMIFNWVIYGDLNDMSGEFFVRIHDKIEDDEIWEKRYELIYANLPIFADKDFYEKIFSIGKCVNFIKRYCSFPQFSLNDQEIKERLFLEEEEILSNNDLINKEKIDDENLSTINPLKNNENGVNYNNSRMEIDSYNNNIQQTSLVHYNRILTIEEQSNLNNFNTNQNNIVENNNNSNCNNNNNIQLKDTFTNNLKNINQFILAKQKLNIPKRTTKKALKLIFSKQPINSLTDLSDLKREIDVIHKEINKYLVEILFKKFYFEDHLKAIYNYLLLGQGDMMQYLMDLLVEDLNKSAHYIQKHNLRSRLDTAISSSNAQFHKFKYNIDVKLLDSSSGDTGWDIFLLQYQTSLPLSVIFKRKNMLMYEKLFFFFWKLKRLEFTNDHDVWRKFMTQSHIQKSHFDNIRRYVHRALLFNQQIIHFVSTIHNYITLEVLETHTKRLKIKLKSVSCLDDLIKYHNEFVVNVIEQSLLNDDNVIVYKTILQVFDVIFRYKMAVDVLNSTLMESFMANKRKEHYKEINDQSPIIHEPDNNYLEQNFKFSAEAFNQIKTLFEEYKVQISGLIKTLEVVGKGNFKYLAMKLDFNGYYSDLETRMLGNNFDDGDNDDFGEFNNDPDNNHEDHDDYDGNSNNEHINNNNNDDDFSNNLNDNYNNINVNNNDYNNTDISANRSVYRNNNVNHNGYLNDDEVNYNNNNISNHNYEDNDSHFIHNDNEGNLDMNNINLNISNNNRDTRENPFSNNIKNNNSGNKSSSEPYSLNEEVKQMDIDSESHQNNDIEIDNSFRNKNTNAVYKKSSLSKRIMQNNTYKDDNEDKD